MLRYVALCISSTVFCQKNFWLLVDHLWQKQSEVGLGPTLDIRLAPLPCNTSVVTTSTKKSDFIKMMLLVQLPNKYTTGKWHISHDWVGNPLLIQAWLHTHSFEGSEHKNAWHCSQDRGVECLQKPVQIAGPLCPWVTAQEQKDRGALGKQQAPGCATRSRCTTYPCRLCHFKK